MTKEEALENTPTVDTTTKRTEKRTETHGVCLDMISRQAAIDALCSECQGRCIPCDSYPCSEIEVINALPSAQPELSIPISWIKEQINWLKGVDNGFAKLSAMNIEVLLKKWMKGEEDATD